MGIKLSKARCRALVISCSDFRFVSAQRQARLDLGLNNAYDLIARPGGVRQIVLPTSEAARQTMEEEIQLLHDLHHFGRILDFLREIGEVLGVSESRVCQLHSQAIVRLRSRIAGAREPDEKRPRRGRPPRSAAKA